MTKLSPNPPTACRLTSSLTTQPQCQNLNESCKNACTMNSKRWWPTSSSTVGPVRKFQFSFRKRWWRIYPSFHQPTRLRQPNLKVRVTWVRLRSPPQQPWRPPNTQCPTSEKEKTKRVALLEGLDHQTWRVVLSASARQRIQTWPNPKTKARSFNPTKTKTLHLSNLWPCKACSRADTAQGPLRHRRPQSRCLWEGSLTLSPSWRSQRRACRYLPPKTRCFLNDCRLAKLATK